MAATVVQRSMAVNTAAAVAAVIAGTVDALLKQIIVAAVAALAVIAVMVVLTTVQAVAVAAVYLLAVRQR